MFSFIKRNTTHLPYNRLKKYLLLYLGLVLISSAGAFLSYRILGPQTAFVGVLIFGWLICTRYYFSGFCRTPRHVVALVRRSRDEHSMRCKGICPIHGSKVIEHRRPEPIEGLNIPAVDLPFCTRCNDFVNLDQLLSMANPQQCGSGTDGSQF